MQWLVCVLSLRPIKGRIGWQVLDVKCWLGKLEERGRSGAQLFRMAEANPESRQRPFRFPFLRTRPSFTPKTGHAKYKLRNLRRIPICFLHCRVVAGSKGRLSDDVVANVS